MDICGITGSRPRMEVVLHIKVSVSQDPDIKAMQESHIVHLLKREQVSLNKRTSLPSASLSPSNRLGPLCNEASATTIMPILAYSSSMCRC